jgi:predicted ribosomally synthesized peptide with nif11-like leader
LFGKDDSKLCDKLHKAKTAEEYLGICGEEGIGLSAEEKESISAAFEGKNTGSLSDEELNGVAGGYIPFIDECRDSWNEVVCLISNKGCSHLKRTKFETDKTGRFFAYYTCTKGCFSSLKRDITNADHV